MDSVVLAECMREARAEDMSVGCFDDCAAGEVVDGEAIGDVESEAELVRECPSGFVGLVVHFFHYHFGGAQMTADEFVCGVVRGAVADWRVYPDVVERVVAFFARFDIDFGVETNCIFDAGFADDVECGSLDLCVACNDVWDCDGENAPTNGVLALEEGWGEGVAEVRLNGCHYFRLELRRVVVVVCLGVADADDFVG